MDKTEALTFPELLETVPNDSYLNIQHETEPEVRIIPVGRYCHNAAAELRRLHAENETLKKSVARLQQHHATAWNRGHTMGMKANEDTARRALEAVKQDAWGNTQLTEALLKAEDQRDALLEALRAMRVKYGQYACRVCDLADAAIAKAEGEKT